MGPADADTFLAAYFGRFYGGRARRIRRVLGEFRVPRSVFVTLPAVGLEPHLVRALGEEMGFVFQGLRPPQSSAVALDGVYPGLSGGASTIGDLFRTSAVSVLAKLA